MANLDQPVTSSASGCDVLSTTFEPNSNQQI